jgi:hypothetical protein
MPKINPKRPNILGPYGSFWVGRAGGSKGPGYKTNDSTQVANSLGGGSSAASSSNSLGDGAPDASDRNRHAFNVGAKYRSKNPVATSHTTVYTTDPDSAVYPPSAAINPSAAYGGGGGGAPAASDGNMHAFNMHASNMHAFNVGTKYRSENPVATSHTTYLDLGHILFHGATKLFSHSPNMQSKNPEINEYIESHEPDFNGFFIAEPRKSKRLQEIEDRKKQIPIQIPLVMTEIDIPGKTNEIDSEEIDVDHKNISQILEEDEKKRKNVETPCWELLNAIVVVGADYSKCETNDELIKLINDNSRQILFADETKREAYYSDLRNRKFGVVIQYLNDCREKMPVGLKTILGVNCKNVIECFVYGKTVPRGSDVEKLNEGLDKKEAKGDLYIKILSPNRRSQYFLAIDNKMSRDCTSSNYAVWVTARGGLIDDESWRKLCYEALQDTHRSLGVNNSRANLQTDLHDVDHVVWSNYIEGIAQHNEQMKQKLIELLFCHAAQKRYPIYKFDGNQWTDYTKYRRDEIDFDASTFVRNTLKQTGEVAKIFYILTIVFKDGREPMIVDCFIRFKLTDFKPDQIVGDVLAQLNMVPQFPEHYCAPGGGGGGGGGGRGRGRLGGGSRKPKQKSFQKRKSLRKRNTQRRK